MNDAARKPSVNDTAWRLVLAEPSFRDALSAQGYFYIDSACLKALTDREPRLLTKHDFSAARPAVFAERGLNVWPVSRSRYLVGAFDVFHRFPSFLTGGAGGSAGRRAGGVGPPRYLPLPRGIESLDFAGITSESLAINAATISGIYADFLGTDNLHATVAGRMSTGQLDIQLAGRTIHIDRAQMELDAGFESPDLLCLVEAKNRLSDDFNIRQLYFPYRRFQAAMSKPVVPVYQIYSNGIFRLLRYRFRDLYDPNSIELVDSARYCLAPLLVDVEAATHALNCRVQVPSVTFPQANNLERVINLIEFLSESPRTWAELAEEFGVVGRQAQYYANAAAYLGFVDRMSGGVCLNAAGRDLVALTDPAARNLTIIAALAARPIFRTGLELLLSTAQPPSPTQLVDALSATHDGQLSASTARRRAQTVASWLRWVREVVFGLALEF